MLNSYEIVVPAYNEAKTIENTIRQIHNFLNKDNFDNWLLTLASNASTDDTLTIGLKLASELNNFRALNIPIKGKGQAIFQSWLQSTSDIVAFLDADLSVPPSEIPKIIAPVKEGYAVAAIGCRYIKGAKANRDLVRHLTSFGYNNLAKAILKTPYLDHQCGFKAINRHTFLKLEPHLIDREWFFDTELLFLLHQLKLPVVEVPVTWQETRKSGVNIVKNSLIGWRSLQKFRHHQYIIN